MGLETVELVMEIEDKFNIQISNEDASNFETIGDIFENIIKVLNIKKENEELIWEKLKKIVILQLGVKPNQVTKDARIIKDLNID